jgi:hypothetical protein
MLINNINKLPAQGWEVFYKDGKIFSSLFCDWVDIPQNGVLVVVIWHGYHVPGARKKTMMSGHDYYYYKDKTEWGCTNHYEKAKAYEFKRGVWTIDEHMEEIHRLAFEKLDNG